MFRLGANGVYVPITPASSLLTPWADGSAAIMPFTGAGETGLNLSTNIGPNALLKSASYPLPSVTSASQPGPLTQVPLASGSLWVWNSGTSGDVTDATGLWGSPTQPYVYNNSASNLGGIVPAGGEIIDGYIYPSGTYVFQFMDFSKGSIALELGMPSVLFRGCRWRRANTSPGNVSCTGGGPGSYFANNLNFHYCEGGGNNALSLIAEDAFCGGVQCAGYRIYRSHASRHKHTVHLVNLVTTYLDAHENGFEKPSWDGVEHLNGIFQDPTTSTAIQNCSILRNNVVYWTLDDLGNTVEATESIYMSTDYSTYPGTGTNADGTTGYVIDGNYCGGGQYPYYLGGDPNIHNLTFGTPGKGNLVTTAYYSTGGASGPVAFIPTWGSNGNTKNNNLWADGANVGTAFV